MRSLLGTRGALAGTSLFWDGGDKGLFGAFFSGGRRDSGDGIGDVLIYGVVIVVVVIRVLDQEEVVVLFALVLAGGWRSARRRVGEGWRGVTSRHTDAGDSATCPLLGVQRRGMRR